MNAGPTDLYFIDFGVWTRTMQIVEAIKSLATMMLFQLKSIAVGTEFNVAMAIAVLSAVDLSYGLP